MRRTKPQPYPLVLTLENKQSKSSYQKRQDNDTFDIVQYILEGRCTECGLLLTDHSAYNCRTAAENYAKQLGIISDEIPETDLVNILLSLGKD
jgi:hypothetical protein